MNEKNTVHKTNGRRFPIEVARIDIELRGGKVAIVAEKLMSKNLVVVDFVDFREDAYMPERERLFMGELKP